MANESENKGRMGVQCLKCGDILVSYSRHDFFSCRCEACFIDGGSDYVRIGGNGDDYTIVFITELKELGRRPYLEKGITNESNPTKD